MVERSQIYQRYAPLRRALGPFGGRPRLTVGIAAGLLLFGGLTLGAPALSWSTRAIVSWDLTCLVFIVSVLAMMRGSESRHIQARAAEQDEAAGFILTVVLIAAAASLGAVGLELSQAKDAHGLGKGLRVGAALCTVALSWFTVHVIFALHYAHEYYAPDDATPEDDVIGGLLFPGNQPPDYWDFLHFAVVIGVASQTADIAFTSKSLRRIGTVQGLVSFVFNTMVLALTINLAAGLF